jgi:hypothetical protein
MIHFARGSCDAPRRRPRRAVVARAHRHGVVPGHAVADAAVYDEAGRLRAQVNLTNLTDHEYFHRAAFTRNRGVIPGEALEAIATVTIRP